MKQYLAEVEGAQQAPDSLRLLPHDIQQVILAFVDQAASTARETIADELIDCRQVADNLAGDNERLSAEVESLQAQLVMAAADRAAAEGRAVRLENDLAATRVQVNEERSAAEHARSLLARAELRLESIVHLEDELRNTRTELEAQRAARFEAECTAAVLGSQRKDQEERANDLKSELACAREAFARSETRNIELSQMLEREREARMVVQQDLAELLAVQTEPALAGPKKTRDARTRAL